MKRKEFLQKGIASSAFLGTAILAPGLSSENGDQK
jgi:hypothetical protein